MVPLAPLGYLFLILGILLLFRPVIETLIKLRNSLMGVQTKITNGTILWYRVGAVLWIIFSLLIIMGWLHS